MSAPCSWCEAERGERTRGSHGICERHAALLKREVEEMGGERLSGPYAERWLAKVSSELESEQARYAPEGKRCDQTEFSAIICFVLLAAGAAIAFGVWVWRAVL